MPRSSHLAGACAASPLPETMVVGTTEFTPDMAPMKSFSGSSLARDSFEHGKWKMMKIQFLRPSQSHRTGLTGPLFFRVHLQSLQCTEIWGWAGSRFRFQNVLLWGLSSWGYELLHSLSDARFRPTFSISNNHLENQKKVAVLKIRTKYLYRLERPLHLRMFVIHDLRLKHKLPKKYWAQLSSRNWTSMYQPSEKPLDLVGFWQFSCQKIHRATWSFGHFPLQLERLPVLVTPRNRGRTFTGQRTSHGFQRKGAGRVL